MQRDLGWSTFLAHPGSGSVAAPRREERNYNMEDPSFPLDDPASWSDGAVAAAGRKVSETTALHLPAVYQAITRIASDVARSPLELFQEHADGSYTALKEDPLYRLTAIQPNREMNAFKFWCRVMVQRLVWQNAYIYVAYDVRNQPAELLPLLSDRTQPKRKNGVLVYETETDGRTIPIAANRVIHFEGIGFDNLAALPLVKLMRDAFGLALAEIDFTSRVYRSGGRRGGVLEIPVGMPKGAADRAEEGFRRKYENTNDWFSTVILRDNVKFHEAQMSLRDSQGIESREESVRNVARAFNIRPGHLGVETSGVYGNKSDDTRDYLDMTLRPHMTGIASECRIKLLPLARQSRECFEHNTDDLLQMSLREQFEAYGVAVEKTILTSNEVRGKLGFKPHADGDKLQNPNTRSSAEGADAGGGGRGAGSKTKLKRNGAADPNDEDDDEALNLAHRRLAAATVKGVVAVIAGKAERAAASGAKFVAWLDEKLPAELASLEAALAPVGECIEARGARREERGARKVSWARETAERVHRDLAAGLEHISSTKPPAQLKAAVTDYFNSWENQPCHGLNNSNSSALRAA